MTSTKSLSLVSSSKEQDLRILQEQLHSLFPLLQEQSYPHPSLGYVPLLCLQAIPCPPIRLEMSKVEARMKPLPPAPPQGEPYKNYERRRHRLW